MAKKGSSNYLTKGKEVVGEEEELDVVVSVFNQEETRVKVKEPVQSLSDLDTCGYYLESVKDFGALGNTQIEDMKSHGQSSCFLLIGEDNVWISQLKNLLHVQVLEAEVLESFKIVNRDFSSIKFLSCGG